MSADGPVRTDSEAPRDWTVDPETGRSNSSDEFEILSREVGRIIRSEASTLLAGRSDAVGRIVMAQLAHRFGLAPTEVLVDV